MYILLTCIYFLSNLFRIINYKNSIYKETFLQQDKVSADHKFITGRGRFITGSRHSSNVLNIHTHTFLIGFFTKYQNLT